MKVNGIKALDVQEQGGKLVLTLAETTMEAVVSMPADLVQVTTDAGDTVEVYAGYRLGRVTYDLAVGTYTAVLDRAVQDGTAAALDSLTAELRDVRAATEDAMAALVELGGIVGGESNV